MQRVISTQINISKYTKGKGCVNGQITRRSNRCRPLRRFLQVRQSTQQEEIDATTGLATVPAYPKQSVTVGGLKWAYRKSDAKNSSNPPILMLHGIGSSSYSYRVLMDLLADKGFDCYAVDWIGHGGSDKPAPGKFPYTADAYINSLDEFVNTVGIKTPFHLMVHGYILGQFGLLYAAKQSDKINKLVILNPCNHEMFQFRSFPLIDL
eukprot:TRINITY_DN29357_c0_g1_i1.p1 TRINITY_DN29357_c0_g1~~TRINITY_DN29357_c0_g1_i1.p1  ORF type:complete len:208 (-),score=17.43 TRINITY_DN29357_c0_g1_i1:34-657(-)